MAEQLAVVRERVVASRRDAAVGDVDVCVLADRAWLLARVDRLVEAAEAVLVGVLEALTVPSAAMLADEAPCDALVAERASLARVVIQHELVQLRERVGEFMGGSLAWLRDELETLGPAGRYTPGPAVFGEYSCVRCGESFQARRDFCDACQAPAPAVVRLDRDQGSVEQHASPAEGWPAPDPGWDRVEHARRSGAVEVEWVRPAGGLRWRLYPLPSGSGATSWHLDTGDDDLALVAPEPGRRRPYLEYPRRSVILSLGGYRAEHNRMPAQAQVMADRWIAGYLARPGAGADAAGAAGVVAARREADAGGSSASRAGYDRVRHAE